MSFHKTLLFLHRWVGLIAALPLVLLALTGAVLVFEGEIDRALNPRHWSVAPPASQRPRQELIDNVRRLYPGDPVTSLRLPANPTTAAEVSLRGGRMVTVDPYTGRVMTARRREQILTAKVHQFHTRLLLPGWGEKVTGYGTLFLLVLAATGLPLWWRRKSFGIRFNAPWRRVNYDAHYAVGILGLLPWLALGLSGVVMAFDGVARPAVYAVTRSSPVPPPPPLRSVARRGAAPLSADAALAAAESALPGAKVTVLGLPKEAPGTFLANMKFPEDQTPAGRSRVTLDQFSGMPLWVENARTAPAGTRLLNLNRPIHTGDVWGWPTRIIACLASFFLAVQTLGGVWIWWGKPGKRAASAARAAVEGRGQSTPVPGR